MRGVTEKLKLPALVHLAIAGVVSTCTLLLTQGLISNRTAKLVSGLGAIWIPIGYLLLVGMMELARARVTAARILNGQPTQNRLIS